ncbi:ABC transporter permease [Desulforapulum autotrophicum]|uniref:ABC transporter permease n=1 Tax=Desulforapulum autotrophicum TaxID=2296 RepID=UPI0002D99876|nr:iron ABC transporter permease [Desulforapulum autotrophicum]
MDRINALNKIKALRGELESLIPWGVALIPLIFLGVFYFYPLAGIFFRSFFQEQVFSLASFLDLAGSRRITGIVWFTLWQAGVSTLLTLALALPCAYVMATYRFRGKKLIMTLATIPFVLPTIVVAAAFQALLGANGLVKGINLEHTMGMIFLAHAFYNFSVVLRITTSFWSFLQSQMSEAASMLGATPARTFFSVTLPLLRPAITASAILVFIFCFSSFGVILILGGAGFSTVEVEIYRQAAHLFNLPGAAVLSLFQICCTFAMMWVYTLLQRKVPTFTPQAATLSLKPVKTINEGFMVAGCVAFILLFCLGPMAALVVKSLVLEGHFSLAFYRELFHNTSGSLFYVSPVRAISNSLMFGVATLALAVVVGVCAAFAILRNRHRFASILDPIFMLPLSTSAVTLGFGIIITLDRPPLNLRTSVMLVPIAHTLVAFPFVVRSVLPVISSIPQSLREAAALLGAVPSRVWFHVDLPIMARAITAGAVFAFTMSLGEFGATLFIARPEMATMPVAIYRFLGQPGIMNYGQAMAVSSMLMGVTAMGFFFIERFRPFGHGGF